MAALNVQLHTAVPKVEAVNMSTRIFRVLFATMLALFAGVTNAQVPWLEHVTDPNLVVGFSENAPIEVRLLGLDGPIPGVAISFTPPADTADSYYCCVYT